MISLMLTLTALGMGDPSNTHAFRPKDCPYQAVFPYPYDQQEESAGNEAELLSGNLRLSVLCLPVQDRPVPSGEAATRLQTLATATGAQDTVITPVQGTDCAEAKATLPGETLYVLVARMCLGPGFTFLAEAVSPANVENPLARAFLDTVAPLPKN